MTNPRVLVDTDGMAMEVKEGKSVKQVLFDYSGIAAMVALGIAWGVVSNSIARNGTEIDRLRARDDARGISDVRLAQDMATKDDVQRVSDQVQALASELRRAREGPP